MDLIRTTIRWKIIVSVLLLLAACTPERQATTAAPATAAILPSTTLELTAAATSNITPESPSATPPSTTGAVQEKDCARGDYTDEIQSGGQLRRYWLHVPATSKPDELSALVLVFHGAGIGAERFINYSRFSNVADREGFLIVYPEGLGEVWNTSPGSRDVQFISDLIDHLLVRCNVDPRRIYASGHSNGGGMVNRLGCELADRIAAIAPFSGAYASGDCSPSRPIPVFAIHGTADPIIPYKGIPEWAAAWAERNGCDPEPAEVVHNVLLRETRWTNCQAGADVTLYTVEDLGHDWTHDIVDFGQLIWEFFEGHPMP